MRHPKRFLISLSIVFCFCFAGVKAATSPARVFAEPATPNGAACSGGSSFLGLPKWYKYLGSQDYVDDTTGKPTCIPKVNGLSDIWRIVAAILELLLRVAALIAIGFVVFGGVTYTLSQGNPDKTKQALKTIISSLVGLLITIISTALVTFFAGRF